MDSVTPVTLNRRSSLEERQAVLRQIYRQVLERQPYHHERCSLAKQEKEFLSEKIGVRRFIKELAYSDVYLEAFYFNAANPKFIERCFKHFLGRAVSDAEEMRTYCDILLREGVKPMLTALLDSEEYRKCFGCYTVPHERSQQNLYSPKAFLESRLLNEEHFGQRGHSIPTLYWHALGLECRDGVCQHPEAFERLDRHPLEELLLDDLMGYLATIESRF